MLKVLLIYAMILLPGLISFATFADPTQHNSPTQKPNYCNFLLTDESRIDAEAAPLVKGVYNLLAREFRDLEVKAANSNEDIDVVAEFNSRPALNSVVSTEGRLTTVSISEVEQSLDPIAFGIENRTVRADALQLERSERSHVLARLMNVIQHVSHIRKKGGDSG